MELSDLLLTIMKGLISGAGSAAGSDAFGYLLSLVGLGKNDQFDAIQAQFQTLQSQMVDVENQLTAIQQELAELLQQMNWDALVEEVTQPINDIEAQYWTFQKLQPDDQPAATVLENWAMANAMTDLLTIHTNALGGQSIDPNQPGLLQMFAQANAQQSIQDVNYSRAAIGPGSPLDVYYSHIEQYFLYIVGVQIKGVTLLINAYNATNQGDMATATLQQFRINLAVQCQTFLATVEVFAVNYAPDLMLMDVFGKDGAADPVERADLTIDAVTANTTFYLRLWTGGGSDVPSPFYAFSTVGATSYAQFTTNPLSPGSANVPRLVDQNGILIVPDVMANGDYNIYTAFPPQVDCLWGMFRFSWTNPPDGNYQAVMHGKQLTTLFIDGFPIVNVLVERTAGLYYFGPATTFSFNKQTPANTVRANYSGRTSLLVNGKPGYAGDTDTGAGIFNFGTSDFSVECWICLTEPTQSKMTVLLLEGAVRRRCPRSRRNGGRAATISTSIPAGRGSTPRPSRCSSRSIAAPPTPSSRCFRSTPCSGTGTSGPWDDRTERFSCTSTGLRSVNPWVATPR